MNQPLATVLITLINLFGHASSPQICAPMNCTWVNGPQACDDTDVPSLPPRLCPRFPRGEDDTRPQGLCLDARGDLVCNE